MSRRVSVMKSCVTGVLVALMLPAVLVSGCSQATESVEINPWPSSLDNTELFGGYVSVAAMPSETPLVFAGGKMLSLGAQGFTVESEFPDEFVLGTRCRVVSGEPNIGPAQTLGSKVVFFRTGLTSQSDGDGVSENQEYNELVLVDPANPSERETIYRIAGWIDSVQTFESTDESIQAVMFEWSEPEGAGRAVTLMQREGNGEWVERWSSDVRADATQFLPLGYGFVGSGDSLHVSACVIGHAGNEITSTVDPVVLGIDLQGEESLLDTQLPSGLAIERIEYLGDCLVSGVHEVAFRAYTADRQEWVAIADGSSPLDTRRLESGTPLAILADKAGTVVLTGPTEGSGPLNAVSPDGSTTEIESDSDVTWAAHATVAADATNRVVLVGRRVMQNGGVTWSLSELRYGASVSAFELLPVISSWPTPDQDWYITSADVIPDEGSSGTDMFAIGLRGDGEGAIGTVAVSATE